MWPWSPRPRRRRTRTAKPRPLRRRLGSEMLESRQLLSAVSLWDPVVESPIAPIAVSASTGQKPQSKIWEHDGDWWSVLPDKSGTWLWRLDNDAWSPVVQLSSNTSTAADVKVVGELAHVLMFQGTSSQFVTLEYAAGNYEFWTEQPQVVNVVLGSGVETATIDVDSTGRLWMAYDRSSTIEVRYSDGLYTSFTRADHRGQRDYHGRHLFDHRHAGWNDRGVLVESEREAFRFSHARRRHRSHVLDRRRSARKPVGPIQGARFCRRSHASGGQLEWHLVCRRENRIRQRGLRKNHAIGTASRWKLGQQLRDRHHRHAAGCGD